jgi:hypothetical protein
MALEAMAKEVDPHIMAPKPRVQLQRQNPSTEMGTQVRMIGLCCLVICISK